MILYFLQVFLSQLPISDNCIQLKIKYKDINLSYALLENYLLKTLTFSDHYFSARQFGNELSFKLKIPLIKSVLRNKHYQIDSVELVDDFTFILKFYREKREIRIGKYMYLFLFDKECEGYYLFIFQITYKENNHMICKIIELDHFKYQREKRKYNFFNYDILNKINYNIKKIQQIRENKFFIRYYQVINEFLRRLFCIPEDYDSSSSNELSEISSYEIRYL